MYLGQNVSIQRRCGEVGANVQSPEQEILKHLRALLHDRNTPELPEHLADDPTASALHKDMLLLRNALQAFAGGDFSHDVSLKGFTGGTLKALQAAMRHLTWQVQRVAEGDFTQQVEFLGDFSIAFNTMTRQLEDSLTALKRKEAELTGLTHTLRNEVEIRSSAMKALSRSEATFKYLAGHDPLTETLNRRAFLEAVRYETETAARAELPCSLALLDVDHFKQFNDTHGHQAGDEALRVLVRVAGESLRLADIMGRYGGEEFIFFFAGAGLRPAFAACERIRRAIASRPVMVDGKELPVTVSIGLTEIPAEWKGPRDESFLQQTIKTADKALYAAKAEGRNRVVSVRGEEPLPSPIQTS